jgi:hypothetical protein
MPAKPCKHAIKGILPLSVQRRKTAIAAYRFSRIENV